MLVCSTDCYPSVGRNKQEADGDSSLVQARRYNSIRNLHHRVSQRHYRKQCCDNEAQSNHVKTTTTTTTNVTQKVSKQASK